MKIWKRCHLEHCGSLFFLCRKMASTAYKITIYTHSYIIIYNTLFSSYNIYLYKTVYIYICSAHTIYILHTMYKVKEMEHVFSCVLFWHSILVACISKTEHLITILRSFTHILYMSSTIFVFFFSFFFSLSLSFHKVWHVTFV